MNDSQIGVSVTQGGVCGLADSFGFLESPLPQPAAPCVFSRSLKSAVSLAGGAWLETFTP